MSDRDRPDTNEPKKEVPLGWLGTNNPPPAQYLRPVSISPPDSQPPQVITKIIKEPSFTQNLYMEVCNWCTARAKSFRDNLKADVTFCREAYKATFAQGWWSKMIAILSFTDKWLNRVASVGVLALLIFGVYIAFIYPLVGPVGTVVVVLSLLVFTLLVTIRVTRKLYDKTVSLLSEVQQQNAALTTTVATLETHLRPALTELEGLRSQIKAPKQVQKQGLTFHIDEKQTRVTYCGYSTDSEQNIVSRNIVALVRLQCSKDVDSKLAIRAFITRLFAISEGREVLIAEPYHNNSFIDSTKERVSLERGWTIDEPLTDFRVYEFMFSIDNTAIPLLTPHDHFFRVTMDAIGQEPQHIDFFVNSWEDAFDPIGPFGSGITLRQAV